MPKSRKRKNKGRGASSRVTYSSKSKSGNLTKIVVLVSIAALLVAGAVFLFVGGGGSSIAGREVTTASGLKYVDEVVGTGDSPKPGKAVTVHYTGTLTNGTKFDSSLDTGRPYTFRIGTGVVIEGWDEGIMSMKVGGKRKLTVPPDLGYGEAGRPPTIPPNATLLFDVELVGVE